MKKLAMFVIIITMVVRVSAQVEFGGDVQFSSKNASIGTGLVFSEDPAAIIHLNTSYTHGKLGVSAFYSGHVTLESGYHIVDVLGSYKFGNFTLYAGPEFTYKDVESDAFGYGLIAMVSYSKNKFESSLIYYTDPKFTIHYVIGSASYKISENVSIYGLAAYTTAESCPYFGLVGLKYTKGSFFCGAYYSLRKDTPGPIFQVGFKF